MLHPPAFPKSIPEPSSPLPFQLPLFAPFQNVLDAIRPLEIAARSALPDRNYGMQGARIIRASVGWMKWCLNKHTALWRVCLELLRILRLYSAYWFLQEF
jgi:hypothetical protein